MLLNNGKTNQCYPNQLSIEFNQILDYFQAGHNSLLMTSTNPPINPLSEITVWNLFIRDKYLYFCVIIFLLRLSGMVLNVFFTKSKSWIKFPRNHRTCKPTHINDDDAVCIRDFSHGRFFAISQSFDRAGQEWDLFYSTFMI